MNAATDSPIYAALAGLVAAQRDLITMWQRSLDDMERREEELRDAICAQDEVQARRVDALHTRIDEMQGKR